MVLIIRVNVTFNTVVFLKVPDIALLMVIVMALLVLLDSQLHEVKLNKFSGNGNINNNYLYSSLVNIFCNSFSASAEPEKAARERGEACSLCKNSDPQANKSVAKTISSTKIASILYNDMYK